MIANVFQPIQLFLSMFNTANNAICCGNCDLLYVYTIGKLKKALLTNWPIHISSMCNTANNAFFVMTVI